MWDIKIQILLTWKNMANFCGVTEFCEQRLHRTVQRPHSHTWRRAEPRPDRPTGPEAARPRPKHGQDPPSSPGPRNGAIKGPRQPTLTKTSPLPLTPRRIRRTPGPMKTDRLSAYRSSKTSKLHRAKYHVMPYIRSFYSLVWVIPVASLVT